MKNFIEKVMADQGITTRDLNCVQLAILRSGMTIADVSRASGVYYGTLRDIAIGKTDIGKVDVHKFIAIAHALNMTADELMAMGNDDGASANHDDLLTPDEQELIKLYRGTDDRGRQMILDVARLQRGVERASETNTMKATGTSSMSPPY